jgi:hypothetical protein
LARHQSRDRRPGFYVSVDATRGPAILEAWVEEVDQTRAKPYSARQRKLLQVAGHLAGYGALITYGWYQRRRARQSAAA